MEATSFKLPDFSLPTTRGSTWITWTTTFLGYALLFVFLVALACRMLCFVMNMVLLSPLKSQTVMCNPETSYIANSGLEELVYSGYRPHAYSWDDYPPLKVQEIIPGSKFNSLLLNRYKGGNDYAGWHADDVKLYGFAPTIASVSLGCEREFLLKKRPGKAFKDKRPEDEPTNK